MTLRRSLALPLVALLMTGHARTETIESDLPLPEKVAEALDNYPGVVASGARVDAAKAQKDMLRRGSHEFTLTGSYLNRKVDYEGRFNEYDVTLSRPIRLPGKASLDREAGKLGVEAAENRMEDTRHQASLALSGLWFDWLTAGALLTNDRRTVETYRASLAAVKRQASLRDAPPLDVDRATAALAIAEGQAGDSEARLHEARARLEATFPEIPLPVEPPLLMEPSLPEEGIETLGRYVIARSHEIGAAASEAGRLSALSRRAKVDRIADPSVGMRFFSERGGSEIGIGVFVSVPLGGGYRKAVAAQASAEASAANMDLAVVRRDVEATAKADMSNAKSRFTAWRNVAAASESAGRVAERTAKGYKLGAIDLADLLYAEREAYAARQTEIIARAEARRAIHKLQVDSHTIWAPDEAEEASN